MKTIGIYAIRNVLDGKCYIGQSVTIKGRKAYHFSALKKVIHHCSHLQRAYNKYGRDSFEHFIIELCSVEKLTEREQFWMDFYRCAGLYNATPAAASMLGTKRSAEVCAKISASNKGRPKHNEESRAKISAAFKGKPSGRKGCKYSEQARLNMSNGAKGKIFSPEHKEKIRLASVGNKSTSGQKWMLKNGSCKMVKKELLQSFLNDGWGFGRIINP